MIYVMGTDPSGVVKIGTALNPMQRLKQIQAGHPEPLEVLLAAPGDRATESYLHRCFAERRVSAREWFDFTDSDAVQAVSDALEASAIQAAEGETPHVFTPPIPVNRTPDGHCTPTPVDVLDEDASPVKLHGPDADGRYTLEIGGNELPKGFDRAEVSYLFAAHFHGHHELVTLRDQLTAEIERVEKLHAKVGGKLYRRQADGSLVLVNLVGIPLSIEGAA